MSLKVYKTCCKNCLLSNDRIVSEDRATDIIQDCAKKQTHFFCHKASMNNQEIVCSAFYHRMGHISNLVRVSQRLNMVKFIEQPDSEKLVSHKEMQR